MDEIDSHHWFECPHCEAAYRMEREGTFWGFIETTCLGCEKPFILVFSWIGGDA
jgi:hypothetical protein